MESSALTASVQCTLLTAVVLFSFFLSFTLTFASFGQHNRMRQALWISKYSPMEFNSYLIYPGVCFYVLISCTLWYKQQNHFWLISTLSNMNYCAWQLTKTDSPHREYEWAENQTRPSQVRSLGTWGDCLCCIRRRGLCANVFHSPQQRNLQRQRFKVTRGSKHRKTEQDLG